MPDVPDGGGKTEEDRSATRAAQEAMLDRLAEEDVVTDMELKHDVYSEHPIGYDSKSAWWSEFAEPFLTAHNSAEALDSSKRRWGGSVTDSDPTPDIDDVTSEEDFPNVPDTDDAGEGREQRYANIVGDVYWDTSNRWLPVELLGLGLFLIPPDLMGEWFPWFWAWLYESNAEAFVWFGMNYQTVGAIIFFAAMFNRLKLNAGGRPESD
jgi:hypothetical protein